MSQLTLTSIDPNDFCLELINELEKIRALSNFMSNANLSCLSESTTFYFASVLEEITDRSIKIAEKLIEKTAH